LLVGAMTVLARYLLNPDSAQLGASAAIANCLFAQLTIEIAPVFQAFEKVRITATLNFLVSAVRTLRRLSDVAGAVAHLGVPLGYLIHGGIRFGSGGRGSAVAQDLRGAETRFQGRQATFQRRNWVSFASSTTTVYNDVDKDHAEPLRYEPGQWVRIALRKEKTARAAVYGSRGICSSSSANENGGSLMIYHVLPDLESFSAYRGGALAHTVAHLMKLDRDREVVCISADDTWGFPKNRMHVMPGLQKYARLRGRRHLPPLITGPIYRQIYKPLLTLVKPGDIVWFHNVPGVGAALQSKLRRKGVKLVYHCHDAVDHRALRQAFRVFTADAYIFVSEYLLRYWTAVLPELKGTYVIHNGASEELFYPSPGGIERKNEIPVILYVGRLLHDKGVHVLLKAMELLNQRGTSAMCKIVGSAFSGSSKATPYVEGLLAAKPDNVEFIGSRSQTEVADEFRAADLLCVPSTWQEPFGKVNVEAMACALPVVATRVGGIPEIAREGGIVLVEPNSAEELASALSTLLEDHQERLKLAAKALEAFRRCFTWRHALAKYETVARELA